MVWIMGYRQGRTFFELAQRKTARFGVSALGGKSGAYVLHWPLLGNLLEREVVRLKV